MARPPRADYTAPDLAFALALFYAGTCLEGLPRSRWRNYVTPRDPGYEEVAVESGGYPVSRCWHPSCERLSARRLGGTPTIPHVVYTVKDDTRRSFCSTNCRYDFGNVRDRALAAFRAWCVTDLPAEALNLQAETDALRMALDYTEDRLAIVKAEAEHLRRLASARDAAVPVFETATAP